VRIESLASDEASRLIPSESPSYPLSIPHREQPPLATHGEIKGDTTTLEDFQVIAKLRESDEG
jgi:acetyl-CoA synthetase